MINKLNLCFLVTLTKSLDDNISQLAVCNNVLVLYQANRKLVRVELLGGQKTELDLNKSLSTRADLIRTVQLFLSPTGQHCLLSVDFEDNSLPECFYVCKKKLFPLRTKGNLVTAVGWNWRSELSTAHVHSTYVCLLGTSRGQMFELELSNTDESKWTLVNSSIDHHLRSVYDLRNDTVCLPIVGTVDPDTWRVSGIEFHYVQVNSLSASHMYFAVVTTNTQIFQFVGTIDRSEQLFKVPSLVKGEMQEFPGNMGYSCLNMYLTIDRQPRTLAWLIDPGVFYSELDFTFPKDSAKVVDKYRLISCKEVSSLNKPISFVLTQYHLLLLFKTHLKIVCIINGQTVMEDKFLDAYGQAIGIIKDPMKETVWAFSERAIYRYKITEEDRNIIDIYLQQNDFTNARLCAKSDVSKLNRINCQEAQYLFDEERLVHLYIVH
jgi:hypothetical protein